MRHETFFRLIRFAACALLLFVLAGCPNQPTEEPAPATPGDLGIDDATITTLAVAWSGVADATGYRVYRDTTLGGSFATEVYDGNATTVIDTGLASGVTYHYKVRASNSGGASPLSDAVSGTTLAFAYAANNGSGTVSAFGIDTVTGALAAVSGSPFAAGSGPWCVTVDPADRFLYSANAGANTLSAFTIHPSTGALTAVTGSPFAAGTNPRSVAVDPSGKFLYAANYGSGTVSGFTIDAVSGALTPVEGSPFSLSVGNTGPSFLLVHPSGTFLHVVNSDSDSIVTFAIDDTNGALSEIQMVSCGDLPRGIATDPAGKHLFVAEGGAASVSAYNITVAAWPDFEIWARRPFSVGTSPFGVAVDPSGSFLYTTNRGDDDISGYSIDAATGDLVVLADSPFVAGDTPSAVTTVSSGRFIYAANYASNNVSGFSLNTATGELTGVAGSPFAVGTSPISVTTTR
jgi:6-phosphogluconolactonase